MCGSNRQASKQEAKEMTHSKPSPYLKVSRKKNHSRKIKKRCGSKYHLGGDISVIPPGIVPQTLPKFESAKPVDHILSPIKHSVVPSTKHSDVPPTKHSELQFQFTRHVMSCNNLDEG